MDGADIVPPRKGGRPSREQAELLIGKILDTATDLFLRDGYGATSIETVARAAGISKRTFYHRFDGKPALFAAVVNAIVDGLRPPRDVPLLLGGTIDEVLGRLAGLILNAALSPQALALNRLILSEAARFPELAAALSGQGGRQEAITLISGLLVRDGLSAEDAAFAALQFLQMIISWPQRQAVTLGVIMPPEDRVRWAERTTMLFLAGCRGLARAAN